MASRKLIYSPCSKENFDIGCKDSINRTDGINKQNNIVIRTSLEAQKIPKALKTQNISDSAVSNYKYSNRTPQRLKTPRSVNAIPSTITPLNTHYSSNSTPSSTPSRLRCKNVNSLLQTPECFNQVVMETPNSIKSSQKSSNTMDEISNLTVAVRVRPMNTKELNTVSITNIVMVDEDEVTVLGGNTADSLGGVSHCFQYDQAYWSCDPEHPFYADQHTIFNGLAMPLIDKIFEGYNACLFAYGQTGSGKTYSMMGIDTGAEDYDVNSSASEAGIIPRFCHELFSRIERLDKNVNATVEVSYFEIYNEKIHDLLSLNMAGNGHRAPLKVREHPELGPYVVDLSMQAVNSHIDLRKWLAVGNSRRATAATGMNDKSSRSHSIFSVVLNISGPEENQGIRSKISLVDLAGSERLSHTCASGERLKEGVSINKSLLTLGKVIAALADCRKSGLFVPYRESVLTWLLRENLGGNSRTCMLATISPASRHLDETLSTLRYACQARTIVNRVRVNEDPHDRLIRELRCEVERLRALRQDYERRERRSDTIASAPTKIVIETGSGVSPSEVQSLRRKLALSEQQLRDAQKTWNERLQEAAACQESEMRLLRRHGLALVLSEDQQQPCLVNLSADPMLSGTLLYLLPPGTLRIGRALNITDELGSFRKPPDIALDSPLVAYEHCLIENVGNQLTLHVTDPNAETFVNGQVVFGSIPLKHCDRLVIGGSQYFRISNPYDPTFIDIKHKPTEVIDFEEAHQEVMKAQETCLRKELQKEKEKAIAELEAQNLLAERRHQKELEQLESCLKLAERRRDELESQTQTNKTAEDSFGKILPYKSTFLDDLAKILGEETPTKYSLHEMHLLTREATQRCRDSGLNIEFKQTQVIGPNGSLPMVTLQDKDRHLIMDWAPARLKCWLQRVRDHETDPHELLDSDISWRENDNDISTDALNSSRISLNISLLKNNFISSTPDKLKFEKSASECLNIIETNANLLQSLAHEQASRRVSGIVTQSAEQIIMLIEKLKAEICPKSSNRTAKTVRFLLD